MSDSTNFQVEDLSSLHHCRTEIPNIILEMGLDPYEISLYTHLKRIAGDKGESYASNATLARVSLMCIDKVKKVKKQLANKKLIKLVVRQNADKSFETTLIQIIDWWVFNFQYFSFKKEDRQKKLKKFLIVDEKVEGLSLKTPRVGVVDICKEDPLKKEPLYKKRIRSSDDKIGIELRENVFLTQRQKELLLKKYSEENFNKIIDKLSTYKKEKNKKYLSDFQAIKRWVEIWLENELSGELASKEKTEFNNSWIKEYYEYRERVGAYGILRYNSERAWDEKTGVEWSLDDAYMKDKIERFYKNKR